MTLKEALIDEIEAVPDELLQELLDFLRFIKARQLTTQSNSQISNQQPAPASTMIQQSYRPASGHSLLSHAGKWAGDDLEACLHEIYETRGEAEFSLDEMF